VVIGCWYGFRGAKRGDSRAVATHRAAISDESTLAALNEGLRNSDPRALVTIQQRLAPQSDAPRSALSDEEAANWLETLSSLRTGFVGFNAPGRAMAVVAACRILDRFGVEPTPARWNDLLRPLHDLLSASLADPDPNVRVAALTEVGKAWVWLPGRSLTPIEEDGLGNWKEALHRPVVGCLGKADAQTLTAAVACLGALPIDDAAAPAISYLDNANTDVRKQVLVSFARRSALLSEDMLLKRLHDENADIRDTATLILKTRGLNSEQIGLGGLIFSPRPQQRASVIPLLKDRSDLDPVVWLIQLSRDSEEMVRISAIEALAAHQTPVALRRLAELARSDTSEAVRKAAGKLIPSTDETTASLPPLPGSASLKPKAN
jgi:HEAT repeat protein